MDIYLLIYDNGEPYDMNDNYTIAVFDDYVKAREFCFKKGFKTTGQHGYFKKEGSKWGNKQMYERIWIQSIKLNKELNMDGELIDG